MVECLVCCPDPAAPRSRGLSARPLPVTPEIGLGADGMAPCALAPAVSVAPVFVVGPLGWSGRGKLDVTVGVPGALGALDLPDMLLTGVTGMEGVVVGWVVGTDGLGAPYVDIARLTCVDCVEPLGRPSDMRKPLLVRPLVRFLPDALRLLTSPCVVEPR